MLQFYGIENKSKDILTKITMIDYGYTAVEATLWIDNNHMWCIDVKFNRVINNRPIRLTADLSDWLSFDSTYLNYRQLTTGHTTLIIGATLSQGVLNINLDPYQDSANKPQVAEYTFYGAV
jgi:hypothetical protein